MYAFDQSLVVLVLAATGGYLLGSIPFGMILAKLMGLGNLRDIGSGNIGATNVLRTGNKSAAALTLIFDAGKGAVAVVIARCLIGEEAAQIAGLAAFLGHLYPIWLGFRGGKGVATFLGILLALAWPVGLAACATWLLVALTLRMSSLSALVAAAAAPFWMFVFGAPQGMLLSTIMAAFVFLRHHENIKRIWAGTEPKIGASKNKST